MKKYLLLVSLLFCSAQMLSFNEGFCDLGDDIESCEGEIITLDAFTGNPSDTYEWFFESPIGSGIFQSFSPPEVTPTLDVTMNGNYKVAVFNGTSTCESSLIVNFNPLPEDFGPFQLTQCDESPNDGLAVFDLTILEDQATGGDPTLTVAWFRSISDANNNIPIIDPSSFVNESNPQSVVARIASVLGCETFSIVTLEVPPAPSANTPTPLVQCDDNGDGFAVFMLADKDIEISGGEPNVVISYHETQQDADFGINALLSPYSNVQPFSQTLYARDESLDTGCFSVVILELEVIGDCATIVADPEPVFVNEGDNDGLAIFDLTVNEALMLGSQDPVDFTFSYYISLEDAQNENDAISTPAAYQNIANPQTIYARLSSIVNQSFALANFEIETDGILGIQEYTEQVFNIYPNPTSNELIIASEIDMPVEFQLYDSTGKILVSKNKELINKTTTMVLSPLSPGIYWLRIYVDGQNVVKQIIKE